MKIKEVFSKIFRFVPVQLNFTTKLLLSFQGLILLFFIIANIVAPQQRRENLNYDFRGLLIIALSFVSIILYVQFWNLIFYKVRWARVFMNIGTICLYFLLLGFHLTTHNSLDYSLLYDNFHEIFYFESLELFLMKGRFLYLIAAVGFVILLIWLEKRKRIMSNWKKPRNYIISLLFAIIGYFALVASPFYVYDDMTYFYQSAYRYHCTDESDNIGEIVEEFPYVYEPTKEEVVKQEDVAASVDRPHIFLIFVESFNANFVEAKTKDGKEITPFYNSLIKRGFFIKKFYSNSIQTAKCKFATLCSVLPSFRGKVFTKYPDLTLHSLADVLKAYNYYTIYFKAARNLTFDKEGAFAEHIGFEYVDAMTEKWTKDVDPKYNWGWGVQDNIYYQKYFNWLDDYRKQFDDKKRFFTVLSTISNHARFNRVPSDQWEMYKDPQDMVEDYSNSINVTDNYLREFFKQLESRDYLKNSLVIVMGDHSYPIGEHGNFHNEVGAYEESFRMPFVMIWNGKLQPTYVTDYAWSEVDIAPSILDLLDIRTKNHFVGESFFSKDKKSQHEMYMVQPYDGLHLIVNKYPYKYVKHVRTNREFLYNLEDDPLEEHNLIKKFKKTELLEELRLGLHKLYINQKLIQQDRIWPKDEK